MKRDWPAVVQRVARALRTRPRVRDVAELLLAAGVLASAGAALSFVGGLAQWSPRAPGEVLILALRAVFVPVLGEELVFRAALVPDRTESAKPAVSIVLSTALFVLWHVAETTFLPGSAATFLRWDFLSLAAALGLFCAILRHRSGSIWTAAALHWLVVVAWQGWFGGPSFGGAL